MDLLDIAIVKQLAGGGGGSGTDNYNDLSNLPKINDTTLSGNKTAASLGLQNEINSDNKLSSDLIDDTGATNLFVTDEEKLEWSGKQDEITNANKLDADLVDDEESTNKFVTAQDKETWNAKQNAIDSTHKLSSDLVDDTNHTNKFVTSQEKETWSGKQDALTFDNSPTSESNNPVKSGGIYAALGNKFDTSNIIQSSSGIPASPTDSTVMSAKNVAENYTPNSSLVPLINNGVKNVCYLYDVISYRSCSPRRIGNGGLHLECTNATWTQYFSNLYLEPNTEYVLFTRISNFSGNIGDLKIRVQTIDETTNLVQYSPTQEGDHASTFVTSNDLNLKLAVLINDSVTARTQSADIWVMICTKSQFGISPAYVPYAESNAVLTQKVKELEQQVKIYTYHVNPNESDPEEAVTYLDDATGLTPAKMGASSFSYGSWANAWFLPKPCMLKSDGTVAYYLNPNDYSKKTDGTASDIADSAFDGNVMLEFPKIWVKRVNDGNGARTVSIAPVNVDGTYKCWSNINADNQEVDHFYLPAYNGTIHSSKMRSLSGVTLNSTYAPNYNRSQEVTAATANNPSGKNMWYTETWADMCLVYDLLYLMGKSLDVQRTFGQGLSSGSETAMRAYVTGTHNAKGLFYGDISETSTAVKVLGMENLWGCRWHGVAGLINDNGTLKVKMTYGVADGSSAVGYNTTGTGYLNYGSTYGTNGFVKKMQADNTMGYKIIETAGTDATYYCDYYYANNSQSNYALLGGSSGDGSTCGFYVDLRDDAGVANWNIGGALSCRPQVG